MRDSKSSLADVAAVDYSSPPSGGKVVENPFADQRLRAVDRMLVLALGAVLALMLVTAWRLTPSPRGLGTHQQLGLAPCTVEQWFGMRCPSCGMTTAWAHVVRGQLPAALRANAGGALLAGLALAGAPWLLASGAAGRWIVGRPDEWWLFGTALAIVTITLVQWAVRVSLGW
jgi:hypothetical protein